MRYQHNSLFSARQVYHAWFQSCTEEYPHCQSNFFPKCHLVIFMSFGVQGHFLCWFPCLKNGTTWCCAIIWVSHCSPSLGRLLPWCKRGDWGRLLNVWFMQRVMWDPAWSGHTGPALYSCTETGGMKGVLFLLQCPFEGCWFLRWNVNSYSMTQRKLAVHKLYIKDAKSIILRQIDWSLISLGLSSVSDCLFLSHF